MNKYELVMCVFVYNNVYIEDKEEEEEGGNDDDDDDNNDNDEVKETEEACLHNKGIV